MYLQGLWLWGWLGGKTRKNNSFLTSNINSCSKLSIYKYSQIRNNGMKCLHSETRQHPYITDKQCTSKTEYVILSGPVTFTFGRNGHCTSKMHSSCAQNSVSVGVRQ